MYENYKKGKESFKLNNRCLSFLILLTFSSQAGFTSAEDVTVAKFEISDLSENRNHQGVIYVAKQKLRIDTEADSSINASIIFRGDQQHMIVLDHSQKTYFIIDENYMLRVGKKLNEALAQMEAYLDQLPEKQKEMARRMMTEQIPDFSTKEKVQIPAVQLKMGQEMRKINGYNCQLFELFQDNEKINSVWATNDLNNPHLTNILMELNSFQEKIGNSVGFANFELDVNFLGFENLEGFPILIETYEGGRLEQRMMFKEIVSTTSAISFEPNYLYELQTFQEIN